jgi:hypothetical protein
VSWLAACRWPPDVTKDYCRKDDWGISWLEMLFSFILFSNMYPQVKTGGQKADAIFWDYNAQEALLLPTSTRAASRIYFTFQQAILAIKTITLVNKEVLITPSFQFFWYVCWSSLPALPTKPI